MVSRNVGFLIDVISGENKEVSTRMGSGGHVLFGAGQPHRLIGSDLCAFRFIVSSFWKNIVSKKVKRTVRCKFRLFYVCEKSLKTMDKTGILFFLMKK